MLDLLGFPMNADFLVAVGEIVKIGHLLGEAKETGEVNLALLILSQIDERQMVIEAKIDFLCEAMTRLLTQTLNMAFLDHETPTIGAVLKIMATQMGIFNSKDPNPPGLIKASNLPIREILELRKDRKAN